MTNRILWAAMMTVVMPLTIHAAQDIGIQVGSNLTLNKDFLPDAWKTALATAGITITSLDVISTDPQLTVAKNQPNIVVTPLTQGVHSAVLVVGITGGKKPSKKIPVNFIGYTVDRTGVISPYAAPPRLGQTWTPDTPYAPIATLKMTPYVKNVQWTLHMFAHSSTFKDGNRTFIATTGDKNTSLGGKGWRKESDPVTNLVTGVLKFQIFIPKDEASFCLETSQQVVFPDVPEELLSEALAPAANN